MARADEPEDESFDVVGSSYGPLAPQKDRQPSAREGHLASILRWNQIAVDATGLDHTPPAAGDDRAYLEQAGPGRASRAMAIVHIAMFDVVSAVQGTYDTYTGVRAPRGATDLDAAVSQAAHDTLVALFPAQKARFDASLDDDLASIRNLRAKANGIGFGRQVADTILALRQGDGAEHPEPLVGVEHPMSDLPGHWRRDPISLNPIAMGAHWGECVPFVLESTSQFRAPPPPLLNSAEYAEAYAEVQRLGGDGVITPTERTPEQTEIGIFWAYDGTPSLCAPPRLYNQITRLIAEQMGTKGAQLARLLALINVAMADTGMAVWESKYYYDFWRPVTGIRESDPGTGPMLLGDYNPETIGDPTFSPLGAPASNLTGPNFTPPFPAYPSGHAGFGGALFQILRRFYGTDDIAFTFMSDEFNGETRDAEGNLRPAIPRSFSSLSQAEEENGQSRIYLGIHWSFDKTAGIGLGEEVADFVYDNVFQPVRNGGGERSEGKPMIQPVGFGWNSFP